MMESRSPLFPASQQRLAGDGSQRVRACVTCDVGARGSGVATLCRSEGGGKRKRAQGGGQLLKVVVMSGSCSRDRDEEDGEKGEVLLGT